MKIGARLDAKMLNPVTDVVGVLMGMPDLIQFGTLEWGAS
jgi:hypothetical protein